MQVPRRVYGRRRSRRNICYRFGCQAVWCSVMKCEKWTDQHETSVGQRKNLSPYRNRTHDLPNTGRALHLLGNVLDTCHIWTQLSLPSLSYTLRSAIFFRFGFLGQSGGRTVTSNFWSKFLKRTKYWRRNGGFTFSPEQKVYLLIDSPMARMQSTETIFAGISCMDVTNWLWTKEKHGPVRKSENSEERMKVHQWVKKRKFASRMKL